eukprot:gnl/TRDRNA2_/TRDRNA2_126969_c0_seq2.p1 gnl/TRDRNA2_/TRDRNA2_126969_c0~~gnl/TRDRNA2_/TRDRNA2_126969_c0_seq2.p1  ORF type:complete len:165 (+),score=16.26 gnl/TRDRNA2_/TRDRNA2_126969_c0_seq2:28-522(+)
MRARMSHNAVSAPTASVSPARLAVVTGAGSGIGQALCLALTARGLRVLGVGRRADSLAQTQRDATASGAAASSLEVVAADVSCEEGREAVVARTHELLASGGSLACLVHNAAIVGPTGSPQRLTPADFRATQATNVEGPLFLTLALAELLAKTQGEGLTALARG